MITRVGPVCLECVSLSGWSLFAVLAHSIRFDCLGRDRWSFCGVKVATHVVSDWILNSGYLCSEILASNFHPVSICATDKYTNTTTNYYIDHFNSKPYCIIFGFIYYTILLLSWLLLLLLFIFFVFISAVFSSIFLYFLFCFDSLLKKRMSIFRKYKSRYYYNTYKIKLSLTKNDEDEDDREEETNQETRSSDQRTPFLLQSHRTKHSVFYYLNILLFKKMGKLFEHY